MAGGKRRWWRIAAATGLLTMATITWFGVQPVPDCGRPLSAPMLTFELARSRDTLAVVLDCAPRRAELDRQNVIDLALFMWVYTLFFAAFARAAGAGRWLVLSLAAGILAGDLTETVILRLLALNWPSPDLALLPALVACSRLKFVLIGVIMGLCGRLLCRRGGWLERSVASLAFIGGAITAAAIWPPALPLFPLIGVAWLAMTVCALVNALRRPPSAPSSPGA